MTRDPNETEASYPLLFLSTSGHKPGALTGHGLFLYQSAVERGHAIKTVVGDRAYFPGAKPEDLQRPLAQAGVKVVMDYKNEEEELGQQAFYASADGRHNLVMVTGSWHLRFMPAALIDAEKTYLDYLKTITNKPEAERSKLRDEAHALLRQRRKERSRYRLIPRSGYDATRARQYSYPGVHRPEGLRRRVRHLDRRRHPVQDRESPRGSQRQERRQEPEPPQVRSGVRVQVRRVARLVRQAQQRRER